MDGNQSKLWPKQHKTIKIKLRPNHALRKKKVSWLNQLERIQWSILSNNLGEKQISTGPKHTKAIKGKEGLPKLKILRKLILTLILDLFIIPQSLFLTF